MAAIALIADTTGQGSNASLNVVESTEQMTLVAGVALQAGSPVRIDGTTGRWILAEGDSVVTNKAYGVATKKAAIGDAVTAIKCGVLGGFDLSGLAYWADVFINDSGVLDTAAGTASKIVGQVIPVRGMGPTPTAYAKALMVNL